MTIDKAIKTLTEIIRGGSEPGYPDEKDAIKLGLEALKEVKKSRIAEYQPFIGILPGEDSN